MKTEKNNLDPEIREVLKEIGKRVREIRKKQTSNYEEFAKTHGINKVTLQRMETGENTNLASFILICRKLGVAIGDILKDF